MNRHGVQAAVTEDFQKNGRDRAQGFGLPALATAHCPAAGVFFTKHGDGDSGSRDERATARRARPGSRSPPHSMQINEYDWYCCEFFIAYIHYILLLASWTRMA